MNNPYQPDTVYSAKIGAMYIRRGFTNVRIDNSLAPNEWYHASRPNIISTMKIS